MFNLAATNCKISEHIMFMMHPSQHIHVDISEFHIPNFWGACNIQIISVNEMSRIS